MAFCLSCLCAMSPWMVRNAVVMGRATFVSSEAGYVFVVEADSKFSVLATNRLGGLCLATPAASDGTLFFRTTDKLLAVRGK